MQLLRNFEHNLGKKRLINLYSIQKIDMKVTFDISKVNKLLELLLMIDFEDELECIVEW